MKLYLIVIFNSKKYLNIETSRETYIAKKTETKNKNGNLETKNLDRKTYQTPRNYGKYFSKGIYLEVTSISVLRKAKQKYLKHPKSLSQA